MRDFFLIVAAVLASMSVSADTIFKCVDASGKTVFSDRKCSEAAEPIEFKHHETWQQKLTRERAEREAATAESNRRLEELQRERNAIFDQAKVKHAKLCEARSAQTGLVIGMTKNDLLENEIWGYPDDSSKTTTANVVKEYLVYKCKGYKDVRLFVTNGRLTSIHN